MGKCGAAKMIKNIAYLGMIMLVMIRSFSIRNFKSILASAVWDEIHLRLHIFNRNTCLSFTRMERPANASATSKRLAMS